MEMSSGFVCLPPPFARACSFILTVCLVCLFHQVSTTVQNTERLFDTQLAHFTHSESQRSAVLITTGTHVCMFHAYLCAVHKPEPEPSPYPFILGTHTAATLPVDISQYVRGVVGLTEVMSIHHIAGWPNKNRKVCSALSFPHPFPHHG